MEVNETIYYIPNELVAKDEAKSFCQKDLKGSVVKFHKVDFVKMIYEWEKSGCLSENDIKYAIIMDTDEENGNSELKLVKPKTTKIKIFNKSNERIKYYVLCCTSFKNTNMKTKHSNNNVTYWLVVIISIAVVFIIAILAIKQRSRNFTVSLLYNIDL